MSSNQWSTVYASVIGTSHLKTGAPCQDASQCRTIKLADEQEVFIGIVSDGAGSASHSQVGSEIAVNMFLKKFTEIIQIEDDIYKIDKDCILNFLNEVRLRIFEIAESEGLSAREFACTILGAIVGLNHSIFFQIGDGAIVISETGSNDYGWIFWPQHGEFANQTNFITQDNVAEVFEFCYLNKSFYNIALFTDGMERLILDFSNQSVFAPSLNSIFEWLQNNLQINPDENPSLALTTYLNSSFINDRTDDDKSLIMASRFKRE